MKPEGISTRYPSYRIVAWAYLGILALGPLSGLFWRTDWGWMKANWVFYPIIFMALAGAIYSSRKIPAIFWAGIAAFLLYAAFFFGLGKNLESIVRTMVALLPLFLMDPLREMIDQDLFTKFRKAYGLILLVPIFISALQLMGVVPYYDPGMAYDIYPGRLTGGYLKPNNLNAVLFPAYLYGFYLFYKGKKLAGATLAGGLFLVVLVGGLRTSVIAYFLIFLLSMIPRLTNAILYQAFRYGVFMVIAISAFFLLSHSRESFGLQAGLRKRLPMWMIHSEYFFHSKPIEIVLGKGDVQLPPEAAEFKIASLSEVHNNDFRLMITFGLVGYVLYGLLLRDVSRRIYSAAYSDQLKFLQSACLIHILVYSVTNEPAFYAGIFWPLTAWIFFTADPMTVPTKA